MMAVVSMALVLTGCSLLPDADVIRAMIKQDASYWTNQEQKSCGRLSEESIYQDDVFSQWGGDGIMPQCDGVCQIIASMPENMREISVLCCAVLSSVYHAASYLSSPFPVKIRCTYCR